MPATKVTGSDGLRFAYRPTRRCAARAASAGVVLDDRTVFAFETLCARDEVIGSIRHGSSSWAIAAGSLLVRRRHPVAPRRGPAAISARLAALLDRVVAKPGRLVIDALLVPTVLASEGSVGFPAIGQRARARCLRLRRHRAWGGSICTGGVT